MFRFVFACTLVLAGPAACLEAQTKARPNIVVFVFDDHGYHDSEPYGATDVRTPNLKRLADAGCRFTHAFVASPSCAPSRAAILTGLMPARNGAEANHAPPRDDVRKLPGFLRALGYRTAAFGKVAHYGQAGLYGFDTFDMKRFDAARIREFLATHDKKQPLCLFAGTHDPHVPWPEKTDYRPDAVKVPATHVDTAETRAFRGRYYAGVTRGDAWLGELYDLCREQLGPNTLFLYLSDHGAQWPFGKWNVYDAGIRIPLLAVWSGVIRPGTTSDAMISTVDLLPTFLELAGGSSPDGLDGKSFAKVLRGEASEHRDRIFATHTNDKDMNVYPCRCVRTRDWHYIRNLHPEWSHTTHIDMAKPQDGLGYWQSWETRARTAAAAAAIVKRYHERPAEELYDLRSDPNETHNLAADPAQRERVAATRDELDRWMRAQGDTGKVFGTPRPLTGTAGK
jgi:arylsulfatase A-like enzyme